MLATTQLRKHRTGMNFVARLAENGAVAFGDSVGGENERGRRGEWETGKLIFKLFTDGGGFSIG
jgi:hypothetical protein